MKYYKGKFTMGMSASQARLLSITARLTNNEFRSQTTTNAKLRLAEKTKEATVEYNTALDSQKLVFMNYDDEGAATTTNLTPTLLYAYEPLKNQYAIIDNSDRMLVSAQDAYNYETTDTLIGFLSKYDLIYDITDKAREQQEAEYNDKKVAVIRDQNKSQWYINLWFAMNGSNTANLAKEVDFDYTDSIWSVVPENIRAIYRYYVPDSEKDEKGKNYKVIEDNLATSSEWLQFAIEQGIVTLNQAIYTKPAENGKKVLDLTSEGVIWTPLDAPSNAKDLIYVEDEEKIAIAEVKYKKTMSEIRNDDNKYDQDLKKLDTEHHALQTEYESIKSVIQKNAERSFKLFS